MFKFLYCLAALLLTVAGIQLWQHEFPADASWASLSSDPVWFGWACVLLSAPLLILGYALLHLHRRRRQAQSISEGQYLSGVHHERRVPH